MGIAFNRFLLLHLLSSALASSGINKDEAELVPSAHSSVSTSHGKTLENIHYDRRNLLSNVFNPDDNPLGNVDVVGQNERQHRRREKFVNTAAEEGTADTIAGTASSVNLFSEVHQQQIVDGSSGEGIKHSEGKEISEAASRTSSAIYGHNPSTSLSSNHEVSAGVQEQNNDSEGKEEGVSSTKPTTTSSTIFGNPITLSSSNNEKVIQQDGGDEVETAAGNEVETEAAATTTTTSTSKTMTSSNIRGHDHEYSEQSQQDPSTTEQAHKTMHGVMSEMISSTVMSEEGDSISTVGWVLIGILCVFVLCTCAACCMAPAKMIKESSDQRKLLHTKQLHNSYYA